MVIDSQARIVIVGGGIMGVALAFHLAEEGEVEVAPAAPEESVPEGPPRAALKFEGSLEREDKTWSGEVPMAFALHDKPNGGEPVWSEEQNNVTVMAGRFEVVLGLGDERLPGLPEAVWLSVQIDGEELLPRCKLTHYRSVVQG